MLRAIAASSLFQLGSLVVQLADRLLLSAIILRYWGIGTYEDWLIIMAAAGLFNLLDLGLHQALSNSYTRAFQAGDKASFSRLMAMGVGLSGSIGLLGFVFLALVVSFGDNSISGSARAITPAAALLVFVFLGASTIIQTSSACIIVVYRAQGIFSRGLALELLLTTTRTVSVFIAIILGADPVLAALLHLTVSALFFLGFLPFDLRRNCVGLRFSPTLPTGDERKMLLKTAPYFYAQHASVLLLQQLPTLILGVMTNNIAPGAIAMFVFLRTLMNFARLLTQLLANSISVEVARLHAAGASSLLIGRNAAMAARLSASLGGIAVGGLIPTIEYLLSLWSNASIDLDMRVVLAFAAGHIVAGPYIMTAAILNLVGNEKECAASKFVTALSSAALCLCLTYGFGPLGVAVALAGGEIIGGTFLLLKPSSKLIGRPALTLAIQWASVAGLSATTACLVVSGFFSVIPYSDILSLILIGSLFLPFAVLILVSIGLEREDQRRFFLLIKSMLARVGHH